MADGFKRIRADGGFGGTHHRIGTVQYRVGHVADFRAGRYRVGNHRFHHLGCGNTEAAQLTGAADHSFLQGRYGGMADFHCQVAAGNHNTVAGKDDFVQIFNGFYALDFGNQTGAYGCTAFHFFFDFGACDVQIFGRFHKADGQVVATDGNRGFQVAEVFFSQRSGRQASAAFVDTFVTFQHMAVFYPCNNLTSFNRFNGQSQQAVVQPQNIAGNDVIRQIAVVQANRFACAFAFKCGIQNQGFTLIQLDAAACNFAHADFRPLQVGKNGDFLTRTFRGFAYDTGIFFMKLRRTVAEIETDDIKTADTDHVFQQLYIVAARTQCGNNFGIVADTG